MVVMVWGRANRPGKPRLSGTPRPTLARIHSKMTRCPLEELAASQCPDELAVTCGNLAADRYDARPAFQLPAFECAIVDVRVLGLCRDRAAVGRIEDDKVGVGAELDRAFFGEEIEKLCDLGARDIHERVEVDFSRLHAVRVEQVNPLFERR